MIVLSLVAALVVTASPADVVARVNGAEITGAALAARVAQSSEYARARPDAVLSTMIDEALLTAEGRRLHLEGSVVARARLETLERKQAGEVFLEKELEGGIQPDDKLLRSMFHSTADLAAFDLLSFPSRDAAAAAAARIRAGASFASEAAGAVTSQVAADPAAAPLGMRADLPPALADALFAASPGAVVGPIPLQEGFGVARLHRKIVGTDADFAARRSAIVVYARKALSSQAKGHVLAKLRERAHAKVDEPFLRSVEGIEPTQAQLDHAFATVSGKPLPYREIADTIRAIRAGGGHLGPGLRIAVAWQAVDARLLEDVAVERGFLRDPAVVALRPQHEAAAVGYAAAMRAMDAAPAPSKEEVRAFYDRNAAAFGRPFRQVEAQAAAGARREKREAAFARAIQELRQRATISVDREALARAAAPRT